MTSVLCSACSLKITAESDRIYCFSGCDRILHSKCADLTPGGITALKECPSLRYVCFGCRKRQICLNDMQNKCAEILSSVSTLKNTQEGFASVLNDCFAKQRESIENAIAGRVLSDIKNWLQNEVLMNLNSNPVNNPTNNRSYADVAASVNGDNLADANEGGLLRSGKRRMMRNGQTNTNQTDKIIDQTGSNSTTPAVSATKSITLAEPKTPVNPKTQHKPRTPAKTKAITKLELTVSIKPKAIQDVDVTKNDIRKKLDPVQFCVKDVFFKPNGEAQIQCSSQSLAMNLLKSAQSHLSDKYELEILKPFRPRLKIVGLKTAMKQEELIYKLRRQNEIPSSADLKVVRMTDNDKQLRKSLSAVIETDARTFALLMGLKHVNIGWDRCAIYESVNVLRCFNCSEYGHTASNCKKPACCPICAEDHEVSDCLSDYEKCVNCTIANKEKKLPADLQLDVCHSSWSSECPLFQKRIKKFRQRIDYSS